MGRQSSRWIAVALLGFAVSSLAPTIQAQDLGFIGVPDYTSATGVPFFFGDTAANVDKVYNAANAAIAKCDREAYKKVIDLEWDMSRIAENRIDDSKSNSGQDTIDTQRRRKDYQVLADAWKAIPKFPDPCGPPKSTSLIQPLNFYLLGGGVIALNNGGGSNVTGVDTFTPGNFLITNQSSGSSQLVPTFGVRAQLTKQWNAFVEHQVSEAVNRMQDVRFGSFIESGIQTSFGAQSFIQPFQAVSTTPQGFGSSTINENLQIPILGGVTAAFSGSNPASPVMIDAYGGITLDSWTQTLQGREAGAPGGPGFFGQNNRFTVDPTVGVGVRTIVPGVAGEVPLIVGLNAELMFRPGSVVIARSANFPSETYYGTVDPHANLAIMLRVGIPIGGH